MCRLQSTIKKLSILLLIFAIFVASGLTKVVKLEIIRRQIAATAQLSNPSAPKCPKFSHLSNLTIDFAVVAPIPKWKRPVMVTNVYYPPYKRSALDRSTPPRTRPPILS